MKTSSQYILLIFALVALQSCKKAPDTIDSYEPNIAPCAIPEEVYLVDSIIYGPSVKFPQAVMRITFTNYDIEFAFNQVPATGMYNMVTQIDSTTQSMPNQIAFVKDSGSFLHRSAPTDYPEVHIENYNSELIISYCSISNSDVFYNVNTNTYIGNNPANLKIRMSY